jgi:SAM-dependent methyltransferase
MVAAVVALPPRRVLPKTADDDPVDYYYKPLTARLYRGRLDLAARLLGEGPFESLLEVGYGSGIFLPELSRRARRLTGIDIHCQADRVAVMLRGLGIDADLREASLFEMPFGDGSFDALVCLSVLEHVTALDSALGEFERVLRQDGIAVLGFPVRNVMTDSFFRAVGYRPRELHPSSHEDILRAARMDPALTVEEEGRFPRGLPLSLSGYAACRCCLADRLQPLPAV